MSKYYSHLTSKVRIALCALLKAGHSKTLIAELFGVHRSAMYQEIARNGTRIGYAPFLAESKIKRRFKRTFSIRTGVTLVERLTKISLISRVIPKHAELVTEKTMALLEHLKDHVFTITADNGCEFAQHELIAGALDAKIFFVHPYHSWERALNENTNGLIRQYIPI